MKLLLGLALLISISSFAAEEDNLTLSWAARIGDFGAVRDFIENKWVNPNSVKEINAKGCDVESTALWNAVYNNHFRIAEYLIDSGADVNIGDCIEGDVHGMEPSVYGDLDTPAFKAIRTHCYHRIDTEQSQQDQVRTATNKVYNTFNLVRKILKSANLSKVGASGLSLREYILSANTNNPIPRPGFKNYTKKCFSDAEFSELSSSYDLE